jgi:dihydroorotase
MKKLLKGGRVVDPRNGIDGTFDVLIDGDRIARLAAIFPPTGRQVVEIPAGLVVVPGTHRHARPPP